MEFPTGDTPRNTDADAALENPSWSDYSEKTMTLAGSTLLVAVVGMTTSCSGVLAALCGRLMQGGCLR